MDSMKDFNILVFDINQTENDYEQVDKLNNLLKLFGGKAEIKQSSDRSRLILSYDEEKLLRWTTRNAGRVGKYYNISVEEVRKMISSLGAKEAAAKLGMTKQGMYKRLKRCNENGTEMF